MLCPHGFGYVHCTICNGGPICIHGDIKELCESCKYLEICEHNRRKMRCTLCRKSELKQCHVYYTVCSALEKVLPPPVSRLIPKNERWNTIQEHITVYPRTPRKRTPIGNYTPQQEHRCVPGREWRLW